MSQAIGSSVMRLASINQKGSTMENFESTLKDLVWKLIQEEVKVEVTRQRHAELTESDNDNDNERLTEDRVNELIGEYINYNVTVSIEA